MRVLSIAFITACCVVLFLGAQAHANDVVVGRQCTVYSVGLNNMTSTYLYYAVTLKDKDTGEFILNKDGNAWFLIMADVPLSKSMYSTLLAANLTNRPVAVLFKSDMGVHSIVQVDILGKP